MKSISLFISSMLVLSTMAYIAGVAKAQNESVQPWATDSTPPFDDVPSDNWAYQATHKLRDAGIVIGYPNGTFNDSKVDEGFPDVPTDHWAYQAVDTLQKAGIVIGYPDGTYGGRRAMTRLDFAAAVARLLPLINSDPSNDPNLTDLQKQMLNTLMQNRDALEALRWLVVEFRPELAQLKQDVPKALAGLDDILKQPAEGLK